MYSALAEPPPAFPLLPPPLPCARALGTPLTPPAALLPCPTLPFARLLHRCTGVPLGRAGRSPGRPPRQVALERGRRGARTQGRQRWRGVPGGPGAQSGGPGGWKDPVAPEGKGGRSGVARRSWRCKSAGPPPRPPTPPPPHPFARLLPAMAAATRHSPGRPRPRSGCDPPHPFPVWAGRHRPARRPPARLPPRWWGWWRLERRRGPGRRRPRRARRSREGPPSLAGLLPSPTLLVFFALAAPANAQPAGREVAVALARAGRGFASNLLLSLAMADPTRLYASAQLALVAWIPPPPFPAAELALLVLGLALLAGNFPRIAAGALAAAWPAGALLTHPAPFPRGDTEIWLMYCSAAVVGLAVARGGWWRLMTPPLLILLPAAHFAVHSPQALLAAQRAYPLPAIGRAVLGALLGEPSAPPEDGALVRFLRGVCGSPHTLGTVVVGLLSLAVQAALQDPGHGRRLHRLTEVALALLRPQPPVPGPAPDPSGGRAPAPGPATPPSLGGPAPPLPGDAPRPHGRTRHRRPIGPTGGGGLGPQTTSTPRGSTQPPQPSGLPTPRPDPTAPVDQTPPVAPPPSPPMTGDDERGTRLAASAESAAPPPPRLPPLPPPVEPTHTGHRPSPVPPPPPPPPPPRRPLAGAGYRR